VVPVVVLVPELPVDVALLEVVDAVDVDVDVEVVPVEPCVPLAEVVAPLLEPWPPVELPLLDALALTPVAVPADVLPVPEDPALLLPHAEAASARARRVMRIDGA
jgi:hypothetical protein